MSPALLNHLRVISAVCVLSVSTASAKTLYVAQTGDGSDGLSWETAFQSVGAAIAMATEEDCVWVKEGVYVENVILIPKIELYGGFSGTESLEEFDLRNWKEKETVLSGQDSINRSPNPIITGADGTKVDGFTLRFGSSGVVCENVTMEVRNCYIHRNIKGEGAGVYCAWGGMTIENTLFERNQGWDGAGAFFAYSQGIIRNCLFDDHWTGAPVNPGSGGVVWANQDSEVLIENCTIGYNQLGESVDGVSVGANTKVAIRNSIVLGVNRIYGSGSQRGNLTASYSRIEAVTGEGNIDSDPEFVSLSLERDYRLNITSPCIDAATGTDLTKDLDGNPRPVDVLGAENGPTSFDMGCFEFQLPRADFNQNGKVDGQDLLIFQRDWYATHPSGK